MSIREDILDQFGDDAETMLFAGGFDDAIIGLATHLVRSFALFMMPTK